MQSAKDVEDTILRVKPVTVVLELDEERFNILERAAAEGSHRMPTVPSKITEVLGLYMSGSLPRLVSQLTDSLSQSVLGATPGGEFVAAARAAQEVGASVVLADRPADVSWHRVENLMRQLHMQEQRVADADLARMRRMLDEGPGSRGGGGLGNELEVGKQEAWTRWLRAPALPEYCLRSWSNLFMPWSPYTIATLSGRPPNFMIRDSPAPVGQPGEWGMGGQPDKVEALARKLMAKGGCAEPNEVIAAVKRIMNQGAQS